jgi:transposase
MGWALGDSRADGFPRTCHVICGMDRQTLRDWVHHYNAEGLAGLKNRKAPGRPCRLTAEQKAELASLIERGPDTEQDGVVRWRCIDLKRRIEEMFGVKLHERTVGKQLKALGYVRLSVRPQHSRSDPQAQEAFKNVWPAPSASGLIENAKSSVCCNVSGFAAVPRAKMEIRTFRSS